MKKHQKHLLPKCFWRFSGTDRHRIGWSQDLLVATDFEKTFSSQDLEPVMYISEERLRLDAAWRIKLNGLS